MELWIVNPRFINPVYGVIDNIVLTDYDFKAKFGSQLQT
jgi:hypothetical protein